MPAIIVETINHSRNDSVPCIVHYPNNTGLVRSVYPARVIDECSRGGNSLQGEHTGYQAVCFFRQLDPATGRYVFLRIFTAPHFFQRVRSTLCLRLLWKPLTTLEMTHAMYCPLPKQYRLSQIRSPCQGYRLKLIKAIGPCLGRYVFLRIFTAPHFFQRVRSDQVRRLLWKPLTTLEMTHASYCPLPKQLPTQSNPFTCQGYRLV